MKSTEELMSMTTKDLVSYVQELQEENLSLKKQSENNYELWSKCYARLQALKTAIKNIGELA